MEVDMHMAKLRAVGGSVMFAIPKAIGRIICARRFAACHASSLKFEMSVTPLPCYLLKPTSRKSRPLHSTMSKSEQEYDRGNRGRSSGIAEAVFEK
jgi:hypothetical protein